MAEQSYENHHRFNSYRFIGNRLLPPPMTQTQHRIYNEHGKYKGRVDVEGRIFNEHGRYDGRIDSNGKIYDEHGR